MYALANLNGRLVADARKRRIVWPIAISSFVVVC
jgi:hypothetical protein